MNKNILTFCAVASIAVTIFSCSKKDDDSSTATTSTTSTTATTSTTSTTSTTKPTPVYPTPGSNQLAIDTVLFNTVTDDCASITQGRYALTSHMEGNDSANTFTATWGKSPNFTNDFTVTTGLPAIGSSTQIQLKALLGTVEYIAQSGTVKFFKNTDSSGIQFTKLTFKAADNSTYKISGFIQCP